MADTSPETSTAASMLGRLGAYSKWAQCEDRTAATEPARRGLEQKFLDDADGDPVRAESLRRAYFVRMALRSAQVRRARKGASVA